MTQPPIEPAQGRGLTGWHVLAIFLGAFGMIIAVNGVLAWFALRTFPGLEVENSYVASQAFNDHLADHRRLGWQARAELGDGELRVYVTDRFGQPAEVAGLSATIGRPTHAREDAALTFERILGGFSAPVELAPGAWTLRLVATAPDGTEFRQRLSLWQRS